MLEGATFWIHAQRVVTWDATQVTLGTRGLSTAKAKALIEVYSGKMGR